MANDSLLAQMAATIAAGIWAGSIPQLDGYKPHHDGDRLSVARVSVETAKQILKVIRYSEDGH